MICDHSFCSDPPTIAVKFDTPAWRDAWARYCDRHAAVVVRAFRIRAIRTIRELALERLSPLI